MLLPRPGSNGRSLDEAQSAIGGAVQDPGCEDVKGSDERLEYPCRMCGAFVP